MINRDISLNHEDMEYMYNPPLGILDVDVQIIAQQCNCVSKTGKGLSADIAKTFPHADFYSSRSKTSIPGTIEVRGGKDLQWVCAMYAQYHPGPPSARNNDTDVNRVKWFAECLNRISRIKNLRHIAFPDQIGCGLARGDWSIYYSMLYSFAEQNPNVKVTIVSKESSADEEIKEPLENSMIYAYNTHTLEEYTRDNIPEGWEDFFNDQLDPELGSLKEISDHLKKEVSSGNKIFPPLHLIYTSFRLVSPKNILVTILGQDPYHDDDQAMGISFSVPEGVYPPPSLKNIYKEMMDTGIQISDPSNGDLTAWCNKGIFLINTALTVRAHTPKSHSKKWTETFTASLLRWMDENCDPMVVILWGNDAQNLGRYFGDRHRKICSVHPSPLSASRGFFGSNPFNRANKYLKELGRPLIDWSL